jgi:hypothetical protein
MNAADDLKQAMKLATRALGQLSTEGADREVVNEFADALIDFEAVVQNLPWRIHELERAHCAECPHARADHDPEAIGASAWTTRYECEAKTMYVCPVVRACGYRDPADPLDSVPAYLKRQAQ